MIRGCLSEACGCIGTEIEREKLREEEGDLLHGFLLDLCCCFEEKGLVRGHFVEDDI